MKHYETVFVVKPTLTEEEIAQQINAIKEIITNGGGEIAVVEDIGVRALAYEVQKQKRGYYTIIYFKSNGELILEIERNFRINENIIKFMTVKYENKKEISKWEEMVKNVQ